MAETMLYRADQRQILGGRLVIELIKAGEWVEPPLVACRDCNAVGIDSGEATMVAFYDYNYGPRTGYDWFYCEKCYLKDPTGERHGSEPKVYLRSTTLKPTKIELKVIVKGMKNGAKA